ncbi:hypothetical protein [Microcoleus sp. B5-D4]|uniref:hypothetical protein n=1 Tax=Microcoleus sp. B5-D4 TaxID=2818681 RepID=UPI002FD0F926
MPVPQRIDFLVEQASCLLLTMVQHLSLTNLITITFFFSSSLPSCPSANAPSRFVKKSLVRKLSKKTLTTFHS